MLTITSLGQDHSGASLVQQLLDQGHAGWLIGAVVIIMLAAFKTVSTVVRTSARERTRREIAAFIAEGSLTPEQGERLMKSGGGREC